MFEFDHFFFDLLTLMVMVASAISNLIELYRCCGLLQAAQRKVRRGDESTALLPAILQPDHGAVQEYAAAIAHAGCAGEGGAVDLIGRQGDVFDPHDLIAGSHL